MLFFCKRSSVSRLKFFLGDFLIVFFRLPHSLFFLVDQNACPSLQTLLRFFFLHFSGTKRLSHNEGKNHSGFYYFLSRSKSGGQLLQKFLLNVFFFFSLCVSSLKFAHARVFSMFPTFSVAIQNLIIH